MYIELEYGTRHAVAELEWGRCLGTFDVRAPERLPSDDAIHRAIARPIGMEQGLFATVRPGDRVAILVSDSFRRTGVDRILPFLIAELNRRGVGDAAVSFVFATGVHRAPTAEEQAHILGSSIYERFAGRAFAHNAWDEANLTDVGRTSRGTRVRVNRRVLDCTRIFATGTVVFHYFAGFGGGRKSILPGITGADTISQNHALNLHPTEDRLDPRVRIGVLDGNPVAEDMLEGARLIPVDGIVNTVLDRNGAIAGVFAGEMDAAHRSAAACARRLYAVSMPARADLVIASSGAARNFVQAHKALYNAYQAMKPGGRIILTTPCEEGLGGDLFTKWLQLGSREAVIAGLRKQSEINGQTALSTLEKAPSAILVSELLEDAVRLLGARKASSLAGALAIARGELPADSTFCVLPHADYTVPFAEAESNP